MATDIYLGPSGAEVLLPPPNWIGSPGDYGESWKRNVESRTMLDGRVRYNFASHSQRTWRLEWALLARDKYDTLQSLADIHQSLRFWNGMMVNPAWVRVKVTFEAAALPATAWNGQAAKWKAMMTLEEEG